MSAPAAASSSSVGSSHSGNYAAFNDFGGAMLMTRQGGGVFVVDNLWLNGWQGVSTVSLIEGYLNGALVGSVLPACSPLVRVLTGFGAIDTLSISGNLFLVDISPSTMATAHVRARQFGCCWPWACSVFACRRALLLTRWGAAIRQPLRI